MPADQPLLVLTRRKLRLLPETFLAWLAWCLIPSLSRRCILRLSRVGGRIGWHVSRRERRVSMANLTLAYGDTLSEREKAAIGCGAYQSFALTLLDLFWFSRFTESRYRKYVQIDSKMAHVLQIAPGIGVTGHLGNWEILSMMFGMEGNPMTAVAMPLKNPFVDRMLQKLRKRTGSSPVPRSGAVRALLGALRSGRPIGLLLDQNTLPHEGGIFVPFFGLPVTVSNAAGLLAHKTQAPVVVAVAIADAAGVYRFVCGDVIAATNRTAEEITHEVTQQLERIIRQYPHYWLWSYKRWRYYPDCSDAGRFPYYADWVETKTR